MSDKLEIRYVPLSTAVLWDNNPKKHDLGGIAAAITVYGFKDPAKWEPQLNGGKGGLGHGNGRIRALFAMKAQGQPRPRGIVENEGGEWLVPIVFGVDAESQAAAEAYAIDHNNLTMAGGDFTLFQIAQMYDDGLPDVLARLAAQEVVPVTMDGDDIDRLLAASQIMEELGNLEIAAGTIGSADDAVITFSFGEFKMDVPFPLYAKFCEIVMKMGSIEQVLTGWLDTTD